MKARLKIIGVDCVSCVYAIQKRLSQLGCIRDFHVDVNTGLSVVEYDEETCRLRDIYSAIRDAGYDVLKEKVTISLKGVDAEERRVLEEEVTSLSGVLDARIPLSLDYGFVVYNPLETTRSTIEEYLRRREVRVVEKYVATAGFGERTLLYRRLLSFTAGLATVAMSVAVAVGGLYWLENPLAALAPVLAVVALVLNYDIVYRGVRSLVKATPTMDSLVALSSTLTFTTGVLLVAGLLEYHGSLHSSSFFEASAGVIGFVGLGRYLEEKLRYRALKSVRDYFSVLNKVVRVFGEQGVVEKPASDVKPGEVVEVRAGEAIPVDGVVVEGYGYVDESTFTGEPTPVLKKSESRDHVLAGCYLVSGYMKVRATRVGGETVFSQVVEAVQEAELAKPGVVRVADRVVGYFTWLILAISLATFTYWLVTTGSPGTAVFFASAVLVVACPCALGIAVPMVVSASVVKLLRKGLVVRRGDVFERLLNTRVVLLDKTGTITHGKPVLLRVYTTGSASTREVLAYTCSVESRSEHPISTAVLEKCTEEGVDYGEPEEYISIPGEGVYGVVKGVAVAVGNYDLVVKRLGVHVDPGVYRLVEEIGSRGNTPVIVVVGSEVVGVLEVGDKLREDAREFVAELKKRGYRVGIASGDVEKSVEYYRNTLNLDIGFWGLKPTEKAELVEKLRVSVGGVIFVGDGVNDAPAIAVADVGVAMGRGAELAREAGDVVVTSNSLKSVLTLIDFAKVVKRKIVENLVWALVYNATLIPIATGLFYQSHGVFITPHLAAVAMILSDVSVVLNALSILKYRI